MVENLSIRKFEPGDLGRLHEIREAAYKPVFRSFRNILGDEIAPTALASAESEQSDYLDKICGSDSDHEVYVVELQSKIVAFCALTLNNETKLGEIDLNAVHPDHQGGGIGAWMYSFALERMKEAGMVAATVGTGGDPSHAPARRAYEKVGFGPAIPSVHMYRSL